MAERLTETNELYNKRVILNNEENQITLSNIRFDGSITKAYYWGKPIDKLAQLEDIMEKYGIESVEELDKLIDGLQASVKVLIERSERYKTDRDTWKRACELACQNISVVKIITNDDIENNIDNLPKYFYEKAKKEL